MPRHEEPPPASTGASHRDVLLAVRIDLGLQHLRRVSSDRVDGRLSTVTPTVTRDHGGRTDCYSGGAVGDVTTINGISSPAARLRRGELHAAPWRGPWRWKSQMASSSEAWLTDGMTDPHHTRPRNIRGEALPALSCPSSSATLSVLCRWSDTAARRRPAAGSTNSRARCTPIGAWTVSLLAGR